MARCYTIVILLASMALVMTDSHFPEIPEILVDTYKADDTTGPEPGLTDRYDWIAAGQDELEIAIEQTYSRNTNVAKNVILFIGDGMASVTSTAARIYRAQNRHIHGREALLAWERFPHVALSRTQNVERMTPDSASTATALMTGHKVRSTTVGMRWECERNDCTTIEGNEAWSILKLSHDEGKAVGVVTNTRATHATPASSYAHMVNRDWESDKNIAEENPDQVDVCKDIARQLVEDNHWIDVVLAGGRRNFRPEGVDDGQRQDGRDLTEEWKQLMMDDANFADDEWAMVFNKDELNDVDSNVRRLWGLLAESHLAYEIEKDTTEEPTLAEMVEKAIPVLQKNDKGFFLLVEGGRIDHAHHEAKPQKALNETSALSDAVEKALELTDDDDTLIVVTGDHSHSFTMQGYPSINTNILGLSNSASSYTWDPNALDDKPFTILMYTNGLGYNDHMEADGSRRDMTGEHPEDDIDYRADAVFPITDETHGGEDVPIYATGPLSHLFHTSHEESYVAAVMMYASCVGINKDHCDEASDSRVACGASAAQASVFIIMAIMFFSFIVQRR